MSREFDKRCLEWSVWFNEHKDDGRDIPGDVAFLKKAVEGLQELLGHACHDLREIEDRKHRENPLFVPRGLRIAGDLTRFG